LKAAARSSTYAVDSACAVVVEVSERAQQALSRVDLEKLGTGLIRG
jgi:hypothetical protein